MISVQIKAVGLKDAQRFLGRFAKQMPYAQSVALNETAKDVVKAEKAEMKAVFDRPTPFTLRSLRINYANKKKLEASVWFKDVGFTGTVVTNYMTTQIEGGARHAKASERAMRRRGILAGDEFLVPSRTAPLDRYGNIRGGLMQKVMANIGAFDDPYQNTPVQWTRKRGRKREFIFGAIGGTKGIYQSQGDRWRLVFLVVKGAPKYRKRFKFYEVGQKESNAQYEKQFNKAWERAVKTAR